jgi:hypothetical protein
VAVLDRLSHPRLEDLEVALATELRRVHGEVGVTQEIVGALLAGHAHGDADAGPDVHRSGMHVERRRQRIEDALGDRHGLAQAAGVFEEHGELVASETGGRVTGPQASTQPPGDGAEKLVARGVPHRVVHRLEVVEIDEQDCHRIAAPPLQRVLDSIGEQRAVGQPGQGIMEGLLGQPVLEGAQLRQGALELPVLQRDGEVPRQGVDEAHVLAVERRDLAQPVADDHQADEAALGAQPGHHRVTDAPPLEERADAVVLPRRRQRGRLAPHRAGRQRQLGGADRDALHRLNGALDAHPPAHGIGVVARREEDDLGRLSPDHLARVLEHGEH